MFGSEDKDSKTELPSRKRLEDALRKGNVIISRELYSLFILLAIGLFLAHSLPETATKFLLSLKWLITNSCQKDASVFLLNKGIFLQSIKFAAPLFCLILIASLIANFLPHRRFVLAFNLLEPSVGRIGSGIGRIFSKKSLFELCKHPIKLLAIAIPFYFVLSGCIPIVGSFMELSPVGLLELMRVKALSLVFAIALLFSLIVILDYAVQRSFYLNSLKMSRQELIQEYKDLEGNPQVKAKIRSRMRRANYVDLSGVSLVIIKPDSLAVALARDPRGVPFAKLIGRKGAATKIEGAARAKRIDVLYDSVLATEIAQIGVNVALPQQHREALFGGEQ